MKAGGVSDPLRSDEGYQILRVDVRDAATNTPTFNENKMRESVVVSAWVTGCQTHDQTVAEALFPRAAVPAQLYERQGTRLWSRPV